MPDAIVSALVAERKRQGLSQREVARRAGISAGGMCEIERGDHSPMLSNLRAWAEALGCTVALVEVVAVAEDGGCREGCKPGGVCRWVGCERSPIRPPERRISPERQDQPHAITSEGDDE